jgi:hypothetical protein
MSAEGWCPEGCMGLFDDFTKFAADIKTRLGDAQAFIFDQVKDKNLIEEARQSNVRSEFVSVRDNNNDNNIDAAESKTLIMAAYKKGILQGDKLENQPNKFYLRAENYDSTNEIVIAERKEMLQAVLTRLNAEPTTKLTDQEKAKAKEYADLLAGGQITKEQFFAALKFAQAHMRAVNGDQFSTEVVGDGRTESNNKAGQGIASDGVWGIRSEMCFTSYLQRPQVEEVKKEAFIAKTGGRFDVATHGAGAGDGNLTTSLVTGSQKVDVLLEMINDRVKDLPTDGSAPQAIRAYNKNYILKRWGDTLEIIDNDHAIFPEFSSVMLNLKTGKVSRKALEGPNNGKMFDDFNADQLAAISKVLNTYQVGSTSSTVVNTTIDPKTLPLSQFVAQTPLKVGDTIPAGSLEAFKTLLPTLEKWYLLDNSIMLRLSGKDPALAVTNSLNGVYTEDMAKMVKYYQQQANHENPTGELDAKTLAEMGKFYQTLNSASDSRFWGGIKWFFGGLLEGLGSTKG